MSRPIEDYALIGDLETAALVSRDGSVDWLCAPRFDSPAFFAALLGTPEHGRWLLAPAEPASEIKRRYRGETLILETDYRAENGEATVIDFMSPRERNPELFRRVIGRRGTVRMGMHLTIRYDYGSVVPWVTKIEGGIQAIAGPDMAQVFASVPLRGEGLSTVAQFEISADECLDFSLQWQYSHLPAAPKLDLGHALEHTESWWREWSNRCVHQGPYREAVTRSLITLKALTYAPTGGIVAAATTSLPEWLGGVRNWDYRYCWVRDATFTLHALLANGYTEEAVAWRNWLLRAVAGTPSQLNIMYGLMGERRLTELELPWLPGYEGSRPVRIGNAAHEQFQLDVFGELVDAGFQAQKQGLPLDEYSWQAQCKLVEYLEEAWQQPDEGIWEVRGPRRHFTHSKVMAWVAFDRMVRAIEKWGYEGPVDRWRQARDAVHAEVCDKGFNKRLNSFVQHYDSDRLDASLLMIPLVGFLPADDPRVAGTVAAIERDLMADGFVRRYQSDPAIDGLPPGEGAFLPCTFWLVDALAMMGRQEKAVELFEKMLATANDLGLLAEEYDPRAGRQLGNFPQAFSHVGLINSAFYLSPHHPSAERADRDGGGSPGLPATG